MNNKKLIEEGKRLINQADEVAENFVNYLHLYDEQNKIENIGIDKILDIIVTLIKIIIPISIPLIILDTSRVMYLKNPWNIIVPIIFIFILLLILTILLVIRHIKNKSYITFRKEILTKIIFLKNKAKPQLYIHEIDELFTKANKENNNNFQSK